MRGVWRGKALTLVDDSYNANPDSVRAAIDVLSTLDGPRGLLLGDMGVAILTGADKWVEARVLAWLPDAWVNLTIGI